MKRRSFIHTLTTVSSAASLPRVGSNGEDETVGAELSSEDRLSEIAERIVPEVEMDQLVVKPDDFAESAPPYECYQNNPVGTPFVEWIEDSDADVSADDIAVRGYGVPKERSAGTAWPQVVDWTVIGTADSDTDAVVSAAKGWEDAARDCMPFGTTAETFTHDRGLSRQLLDAEKEAYRIQRFRLVGEQLFVTWIEGRFDDTSYLTPQSLVYEIEQAVLLRQVQAYLRAGNTLPTVSAPSTTGRWME